MKKKSKKKKGKKKTEAEEEATPEPEADDDAEEARDSDAEPVNEDAQEEIKPKVAKSQEPGEQEESKEGDKTAEDGISNSTDVEESKKGDSEVQIEEPEDEEEPKEEPIEKHTEEPVEEPKERVQEVNDETKDVQLPEGLDEVTQKLASSELNDVPADQTVKRADVPEISIEKEAAAADENVDSLFPDSNQSFLDTLKSEEPVADKQTDQSPQLTLENKRLTAENEKLKSEVKSLKLLKIEHLDEIETLQSRVKDLENKLSKQSLDFARSNHLPQPSPYDDDNLTLSPSPSYQPSNYLEQQQHFHSNLSPYDNQENLQQIKTNLQQFKGWNIDMTNWRSIGEGPIVKL